MPAFDKSVVKKALNDSEDPTPGYLFRDIGLMTFHDGASQDKLEAYLFEKLDTKNSVHVLAKTLNVIKHLCKEGHADFQKHMQRRSDELKPFASYRGPVDPKYGDKLNEKVRNYAKEAIDAAFSHRKEAAVLNVSGAGSGGESSSSAATSKAVASASAAAAQAASQSTGGFITGGRVDGSGSSSGASLAQQIPGATDRCAPMPTTNKWAEEMARKSAANGGAGFNFVEKASKVVAEKLGWEQGVQSKEERMMAELASGPGGFQAVELPGGSKFGGAAAGGGASAAGSSGGGGGGWKFTEAGGGAAGAGAAPVAQKKTQTPIENLVERLATMKATPQRVELSQFLVAAQQLIAGGSGAHSWEELAAAMDALISTKNAWQHRLNVLCAVEHIVRAIENPDAGAVGADFKEYFVENPEDIQRNVVVVQEVLKEKAQRVLKLLGVPDRTVVVAQQQQQQAQAQAANKAKQQAEQQHAQQAAVAQSKMDGTTNWSASMESSGSAGGGFLEGMTVKAGGRNGAGATSGAGTATAAAPAGGKQTGDKTQLKRRGPMSLEQFGDGGAQQQTTTTASSFSSAASAPASDPFGSWGGAVDSGNNGWPTAAAPAPQTAAGSSFSLTSSNQSASTTTTTSVQSTAKKSVDLDDLFGAPAPKPSAVAAPAPTPAVAPSASNNNNNNNNINNNDNVDIFRSLAPTRTPAPAPAVDPRAQLAAQAQQQLQMLMEQSMAAMQRGDTATAQMLMNQQQQLMAQLNALMGK